MAVGLLDLLLGGGQPMTEEERIARLRLGGEDTPAGGGMLSPQGILSMAGQHSAQAAQKPQQAPQQAQVSMPQRDGGGILGRLFGGGRGNTNSTVQWLQGKGYSPEAASLIAGDKGMLGKAIIGAGSPQGPDEYTQRAQYASRLGLQEGTPEYTNFIAGRDVIKTDKPEGRARTLSPDEVQRIGLPPGVYQEDDKGKITTVGGVRDQTAGFSNEKDLAAQYSSDPNVKDYSIVRNNYERIRAGAQMGSGAGDIAIIFGYMKMLDPTSVVRENEQATAENAGGVPDQVRNLYNKLMQGDKLPPSIRQMYVESAGKLYAESAANVADVNKRFGTRAEGWGVDPTRFQVMPEEYEPLNVLPELPDPASAVDTGQPAPQMSAPKAGDVIDGYRFLGGNPADQTRWQKAQ